jgi:arsenate reductase
VPEVTIFHNPARETSRNVLALIRHAGIEPNVIEYLKTPPTKEKLHDSERKESAEALSKRAGQSIL